MGENESFVKCYIYRLIPACRAGKISDAIRMYRLAWIIGAIGLP